MYSGEQLRHRTEPRDLEGGIELGERRFALEPLADLDAELEIPGVGNVSAALAALDLD